MGIPEASDDRTSNKADSRVIWMDGRLIPYAQATVHVLSHSLHYGTGAFEGIRAYESTRGGTAIFRAPEHFQRFADSIHALGLECPFTVAEMVEASRLVIRENEFKECYIRPIAYLDDGTRGLKLPDNAKAKVAIAAWNWGKYLGNDGQIQGIKVAVSSYRRADVASGLPQAKLTGPYVTSVLARREAAKHGCDEALLLDQQGFVGEGSGENLFMVKNRVLFTPPPGAILPGITRNSVIEMVRDLGYEVRETLFTRNDLYLADELFFTGTAVELTPIREVDARRIADGKPGPITKKIFDFFFRCLRGESPEYVKWLTHV